MTLNYKKIALILFSGSGLFGCITINNNVVNQLIKLETYTSAKEFDEQNYYSLQKFDTLQKKYGVPIECLNIAKKVTMDKEIMQHLYSLIKSEFFKQIENEIILNPFSENIVYFDRKDSLSITFYNNSLIVNTLFNKYFDKCAYLIETKAFGGEHRIYFYKKKYWEVELFQTKSESGISPYHNSPLFRNLYGDTITEKISYELYGFESCGKCYKLILPVIIDNIYRFDIELTFVR